MHGKRPDEASADPEIGAAELGPRGKFRYIFTANFTTYCRLSNTVSGRTLSTKVSF